MLHVRMNIYFVVTLISRFVGLIVNGKGILPVTITTADWVLHSDGDQIKLVRLRASEFMFPTVFVIHVSLIFFPIFIPQKVTYG